nr:hypothetical protein [Burkholderia anthina]
MRRALTSYSSDRSQTSSRTPSGRSNGARVVVAPLYPVHLHEPEAGRGKARSAT